MAESAQIGQNFDFWPHVTHKQEFLEISDLS